MKIGDSVFVHGYVDEIRKDIIIIRNNGGYFGTIASEIVCGDFPERKKGKWIKTDKHDIYYQPGYECSVCGVLTTCHGNYCPNCGADMRGEE